MNEDSNEKRNGVSGFPGDRKTPSKRRTVGPIAQLLNDIEPMVGNMVRESHGKDEIAGCVEAWFDTHEIVLAERPEIRKEIRRKALAIMKSAIEKHATAMMIATS